MRKFINKLFNFAVILFCVLLLLIFLISICCPSIFINGFSKNYYQYNFFFILILIPLVLLAFYIYKKNAESFMVQLITKKFNLLILLGFAMLVALQLIMLINNLFIAGWDVQFLYFNNNYTDAYFSLYPNNIFLKGIKDINVAFLQAIDLQDFINALIPGLFSYVDAFKFAEYANYFFAVIINILCIDVSILFVILIINKLFSTKIAFVTFVLSAYFIGFMPWVFVPYSDTISMFFSILILFIYVWLNGTKKWFLICFATVIGFSIKPLIVFEIFAILFIELYNFLKLRNSNKLSKLENKSKTKINNKLIGPFLGTLVLSFILSLSFVSVVKQSADLNIDNNKNLTWTHYLMMGMNADTNGCYSFDDVQTSYNCENIQDREQTNWAVYKDRINKLGFLGIINQVSRKAVSAFSDSAFHWENEGSGKFYYATIYHNVVLDYFHNFYEFSAHMLWLLIIIGCCLCLRIRNSMILTIISISLLSLCVYVMIFECNSRYLIEYLPFFIIMSIIGWRELFVKFCKKSLSK